MGFVYVLQWKKERWGSQARAAILAVCEFSLLWLENNHELAVMNLVDSVFGFDIIISIRH